MKEWELAYEDYQKGMKYKDIAKKYNKKINTVKTWKTRYWNAMASNDDPENKKVCTQGKKSMHKTVPKAITELNSSNKLNDEQKLFCLYYLQSFNATQSYLKAYGCSYDAAMANGYKLLRKAHIKETLAKLKEELQVEQYYTIQDILNEYVKQAFSDIGDYVTFGTETVETEDGVEKEISYVRFKPNSMVDGSLIQEIKQGRDGVSVKLWDKQKALSELSKWLSDKPENAGPKITIVDSWRNEDE